MGETENNEQKNIFMIIWCTNLSFLNLFRWVLWHFDSKFKSKKTLIKRSSHLKKIINYIGL